MTLSLSRNIVIDRVSPQVDCGTHPVKRVDGNSVVVAADIYSHGTDVMRAELLYREAGRKTWTRVAMIQREDDRWSAEFVVRGNTTYQYTVEAWADRYSTWLENLKKWHLAGEDVLQDIRTGVKMLRGMSPGKDQASVKLQRIASLIESARDEEAVSIASDQTTLALVAKLQKRDYSRYDRVLEITVDRRIAGFACWYELFPRSQSGEPGRQGTLRDCEARLEDIAGMGFDVLYLTPIHPIGHTNRRGRNGAVEAGPEDPGSPWAIGSEEGGHKSIDRRLGNMDDLKHLLEAAKQWGMEVAMDIAFQCSPDHPYVREHPEWFYHRADGSIRYAENPPKKYFDIYPLDFANSDWKGLWEELRSIVLFWIDAGVRIFRVDNPHTKPFEFWEWLIGSIRKEHPDVIFLSEAFTRPKVMYELSRIGFSQSYTYFTWKNFNWELEEYFREVTRPEIADFFRPNLFTNTPDILPYVLQSGGRPAFMMRALLAATLSPLWGIYSGFELCENEALSGREEYLNSEKYEIKNRDWDGEGNIKEFIRHLNRIRRENAVLQQFGNLQFHQTGNPNLLFYTRGSGDSPGKLMVMVNINPFQTQGAVLKIPIGLLGMGADEDYSVRDLLTGELFRWHGEYNYVRLVPGERAGHVFSVER